MLRNRGLNVETVETGSAAVTLALSSAAAGKPFDMILMDIQMPEMNGYDATARLRRMGYAAPIIALTANCGHDERARCSDAGFDDYMSKPVTRQALLEMVRKHAPGTGGSDLAAVPAPTVPPPADIAQAFEPLYSSYADEAEMEALITLFVEGLACQVEQLRMAAHKGDTVMLESIAHQLNGAAGGYGFMPVSHAAAALESAARNATGSQDITEHLKSLISVCARVRRSEP